MNLKWCRACRSWNRFHCRPLIGPRSGCGTHCASGDLSLRSNAFAAEPSRSIARSRTGAAVGSTEPGEGTASGNRPDQSSPCFIVRRFKRCQRLRLVHHVGCSGALRLSEGDAANTSGSTVPCTASARCSHTWASDQARPWSAPVSRSRRASSHIQLSDRSVPGVATPCPFLSATAAGSSSRGDGQWFGQAKARFGFTRRQSTCIGTDVSAWVRRRRWHLGSSWRAGRPWWRSRRPWPSRGAHRRGLSSAAP